MKNKITFLLFLVASMLITHSAISQNINESFNDITTLATDGWVIQNNSNPLGALSWFQGTTIANTGPFDAHSGAADDYIAVNYNSTEGGTGVISNWLIMPSRTLRNGDVLTFYTRKPAIGGVPDYPDRLEVRLSTNGTSSNVGTTSTSTGDFTVLLLSINPTLVVGGYPYDWTQYTVTISGLPSPLNGRIAFRYFVTGAGPSGTNSDYIGIDDVVYTQYVCPVVAVTPSVLSNATAGEDYSFSFLQTGVLGAPTFYISAGNLPDGLTLDFNGDLSGTTTSTGTFLFTVSVYDNSGCMGSENFSLTVLCPTIDITFSDFPDLCLNHSLYTLTEASPTGGMYSGVGVSGNQFDPSLGTQTVYYDYSLYGCAYTESEIVVVNDVPNVQAGDDFDVCEGESVTLNGLGAIGYVWDNGVEDGVSFVPAVGTLTYTVTGMDSNNCQSTADIIVTVNALPNVEAGDDFDVCEGESVTLNGLGAIGYVWDNGVEDGVSFVPAVGTLTYTVTGQDSNNCENTADITVTVNALPNVEAGEDFDVCEGESVTLNGVGAIGYVWDNDVEDGVSFIPAVGTITYTVIGTDVHFCSNQADVVVTVNPIPAVSFSEIGLVCLNHAPILLSQGLPAGGTYSGTGVLDGYFNPTSAGVGEYTLLYSLTIDGCEGTAESNVIVDPCLEVESIFANSLSVYPNPANSELNINFDNPSFEDANVFIIAADGRIVCNSIASANSAFSQTIDVSDFAKGIYILKIDSSKGVLTRKIILD